MAYVFELEDEYAESDIPTTLMRSKADCPDAQDNLSKSQNDIVLNKLTQILSYIRTGKIFIFLRVVSGANYFKVSGSSKTF